MSQPILAPPAWAQRVRDLDVDLFEACFDLRSEWRHAHAKTNLGWVIRGKWASAVRASLCSTGAHDCRGCPVASACAWPGWHSGPRSADARQPQAFWWRGLPITADPQPGDRVLCTLMAIRDLAREPGEMEATIERGASDIDGLRLAWVRRRPLDWGALLEARGHRWRLEASSPIDVGEPPQASQACPDAPELDVLIRRGVARVHALLGAYVPSVARAGFEFPSLLGVRRLHGGLTRWMARRPSVGAPHGIPMTGWVGSLVVEGEALHALGPLLGVLGVVGVGGNTALGLGELRATPVS
jgi:hypothetical protein